jgi:hypothetical protein
MSHGSTEVGGWEVECPPAVLPGARSARPALDRKLQEIMRLLDLLIETAGAEQEYLSLCAQYQRSLSLEEVRPDLRAVLQSRHDQRSALRALLATCREAERSGRAANEDEAAPVPPRPDTDESGDRTGTQDPSCGSRSHVVR